MSYVTQEGTGAQQFSTPISPVVIRKLTESQGARSSAYGIPYQPTLGPLRRPFEERPASPRTSSVKKKGKIAVREHIGRLIRQCKNVSEQLYQEDDEKERAILGAELDSILEQLWEHRKAREDDWAAILNILQVVLKGEDFESLSVEKREALTNVSSGLLSFRTVGKQELEQTVEILSSAGFDVWRGLKFEIGESE